MAKAGQIRVGVGGWTFEQWRGVFYPEGLPQKRELEYATSQLTAIEVNGTYYSGFKPATFENWAKAAPDGFVYALKASRFCTNRRVLAEAGPSIEKFLSQGITELGDKLGPILWQFMATKKFDAEDFGAFLKLLPDRQDGIVLRHAVEVRNDSFRDPAFIELARKAGVAIVFADAEAFPSIGDVTGDFVYARLQASREEIETGYDAKALDHWTQVAQGWAAGESPKDVPVVDGKPPAKKPRDTFVFFISGAKVRNPAAAMALIERVKP